MTMRRPSSSPAWRMPVSDKTSIEWTGPIRCILTPEDEPDPHVYSFATVEELRAFGDGVAAGVDHYGAGSCGLIRETHLATDVADIFDGRARLWGMTRDEYEARVRAIFAKGARP